MDLLVGDGTPAGGRVFFGNSGAEANECAIKLARRWGAGRRWRVVSTAGSFHGRTLATWSATGKSEGTTAFAPLPDGFEHIPYDDVSALRRALSADDVAGFMVEPIQGENGVVEPSPGYLGAARSACSEAGVLFMVDEVQTGLGRTGRWFGFQHEGAFPDV
ncbi:Aminotransferase class-III, partial [mine drainage metagenome]